MIVRWKIQGACQFAIKRLLRYNGEISVIKNPNIYICYVLIPICFFLLFLKKTNCHNIKTLNFFCGFRRFIPLDGPICFHFVCSHFQQHQFSQKETTKSSTNERAHIKCTLKPNSTTVCTSIHHSTAFDQEEINWFV